MTLRHFFSALAAEFACLITGGVVGGLIGYRLNTFAVASDPENFWAICVLAGAALGLSLGVAVLAWRGRGVSGEISSVVVGAGCWFTVATGLLSWVVWSRRP
jgi:hypothetical protein